jgi:hypothetical protein
MANLQSCLGSSEIGHTYDVKVHALVTWAKVGTCQFVQSTASVIEAKARPKSSINPIPSILL